MLPPCLLEYVKGLWVLGWRTQKSEANLTCFPICSHYGFHDGVVRVICGLACCDDCCCCLLVTGKICWVCPFSGLSTLPPILLTIFSCLSGHNCLIGKLLFFFGWSRQALPLDIIMIMLYGCCLQILHLTASLCHHFVSDVRHVGLPQSLSLPYQIWIDGFVVSTDLSL